MNHLDTGVSLGFDSSFVEYGQLWISRCQYQLAPKLGSYVRPTTTIRLQETAGYKGSHCMPLPDDWGHDHQVPRGPAFSCENSMVSAGK